MNSVGHWPISGMGGWAIDIIETAQAIGEVAVCQPPEYPETEIGWVLFEGFEKQGYALEAATAARNSLCSASLVSYVDPENVASIQLASVWEGNATTRRRRLMAIHAWCSLLVGRHAATSAVRS